MRRVAIWDLRFFMSNDFADSHYYNQLKAQKYEQAAKQILNIRFTKQASAIRIS